MMPPCDRSQRIASCGEERAHGTRTTAGGIDRADHGGESTERDFGYCWGVHWGCLVLSPCPTTVQQRQRRQQSDGKSDGGRSSRSSRRSKSKSTTVSSTRCLASVINQGVSAT